MEDKKTLKEAKLQEKAKLKEERKKSKEAKKEKKLNKKNEIKSIKEEAKMKKNIVKGKNNVKKPIDTDKIVIFSIVGVVVLIAAVIFGYFFYKTNMEAVAVFDGGKVTKAEYTTYYKTYATILTYYGYPEFMIPEQIANKAAIDKMLLIEAKKAGINISDEEMAKVNETFSDEDEVASIKENGIDVEQMKKMYINEYIINSYLEYLEGKLTQEEVNEYIKSVAGEDADMNQYNTRHILFKVSTTATEDEKAQIKAKAQDVLNRALQGEDFATLASDNSEDTGTASNGGVFTMYMDGTVLDEYANAVKELSPEKIYPTLVETEAGFHIIKLDSIIAGGRVNNSNERGNIVDESLNNLSVTKNLKVNTEVLNKLVESITGKPVQTEEEYYEEMNSTTTTEE